MFGAPTSCIDGSVSPWAKAEVGMRARPGRASAPIPLTRARLLILMICLSSLAADGLCKRSDATTAFSAAILRQESTNLLLPVIEWNPQAISLHFRFV